MGRVLTIKDNLIRHTTLRRALMLLTGNLILGVGVAGLKLSTMGNDPFTACSMAISDGLHMGLGNFQLMMNLVLFACQFLWGYGHIGLGTLINMSLMGYIVQYAAIPVEWIFGSGAGHGMVYCLVYMFISLMVVSFGLSMYQKADLGMAPYDYLSIGMTEHFKNPYFINRVITDGSCVYLILVCLAVGFIGWENSHLGVGTIACAFCLGPFVDMFDRINEKWFR